MSSIFRQTPRKLTSVFNHHQNCVLLRNSSADIASCRSTARRCYTTQTAKRVTQESLGDGRWLHQLDDTQKMFLYGHRKGTRYGLMCLTLNSRMPLSADVVHEAMLRWHRKIPPFQTTIRERDGDLWFYKPHNMDIDFKMYPEGTPKQAIISDCFQGFNETEGPLWRARLLPMPEDTPCMVQEVKKDYPYQYDIFLCPHHSMSDGRTLLGIVQPFVDIINDVIQGNDVDDSLLLGVFISSDEYKKAYSEFKGRLMKSPERLEKLRALILKSNKPPLLQKCFPRPVVSKPETEHVIMDMDQEMVVRFIARCKEMGITGGTGFQTITNTALVELAQEAGTTDENYDLSVNFTIDLRRYMQPRELLIHGCHAHTMASVITLDKNVRDNFWNNCRAIHEVNVDLIKRGKVVKQAIGRQLFLEKMRPEDFFQSSPEVTRDYAFNNLRSVDRLIHGRGKHVQLTEMTGFNVIQGFIFPFMQMFYDYRGCYKTMLSYATDWLTEEHAEVLARKIKSLLEYYSRH